MIFKFVVRYLGLLKHVPMLAWYFDTMMMCFHLVFNPAIPRTIGRIEETVSGWKGVKLSLHRFGGIQFNYGAHEFGHIHSNGIVDILLNRSLKAWLMENQVASDHHVFKRSGWISFYIRQGQDAGKAIELLALAYKFHTRPLAP